MFILLKEKRSLSPSNTGKKKKIRLSARDLQYVGKTLRNSNFYLGAQAVLGHQAIRKQREEEKREGPRGKREEKKIQKAGLVHRG